MCAYMHTGQKACKPKIRTFRMIRKARKIAMQGFLPLLTIAQQYGSL